MTRMVSYVPRELIWSEPPAGQRGLLLIVKESSPYFASSSIILLILLIPPVPIAFPE